MTTSNLKKIICNAYFVTIRTRSRSQREAEMVLLAHNAKEESPSGCTPSHKKMVKVGKPQTFGANKKERNRWGELRSGGMQCMNEHSI